VPETGDASLAICHRWLPLDLNTLPKAASLTEYLHLIEAAAAQKWQEGNDSQCCNTEKLEGR
jgi:hypothetical protein